MGKRQKIVKLAMLILDEFQNFYCIWDEKYDIIIV